MSDPGTLKSGIQSHLLDPQEYAELCTDGVDCRCDSLVTTYGSDIVFCEDFENPRLTEKGVWQKNPSSLVGAGWEDQGYTGISAGCGLQGIPK